MRKKVKINDIALRAGVSMSTVSLVLNNRPGVSPETRNLVFDIASELGYPLKVNENHSRNGKLSTIGMVVKIDPDIPPQANPFYSKVIMGIEDVCRRQGIHLLFSSLPVDDDNIPLEGPQLLANASIDGLILVGISLPDSSALPFTRRHLPVILVDGYSSHDRYDTVISDNFSAAFQAVSYLIDCGHRRIGLAGGQECCFPSLHDRRNGYLRALKEHNIFETFISDFNINKTKGEAEIASLLHEHPDITALFCINDDVGSAAIRVARELGLLVPADLSVIGYDDTYIAMNTHPALTTMHVDTLAMGRAAVHLLSLRLEHPESARMSLTIHPYLVERASVTQPRL